MAQKIYNPKIEQDILKTSIKNNQPLLLIGETGIGKTTFIKHYADQEKKNLMRINLNGQTGREELVGKYVLIEGDLIWQDGPLLTALKKGHWVLFDEINAALPEVLFILQSLLEVQDKKLGDLLLAEKDGEVIKPHKDCRIFATANPSDYIGTKDFNPATFSRFIVLNVGPLQEDDETQLIYDKFKSTGKIKKDLVQKFVRMGSELRNKKKEDEVTTFISTRDLEQLIMLIGSGIDERYAVNIAIRNKFQTTVERDVIDPIVNNYVAKPPSEVKSFKDMERAVKEAETNLRRAQDENGIIIKERDQAFLEIGELKAQLKKAKSGSGSKGSGSGGGEKFSDEDISRLTELVRKGLEKEHGARTAHEIIIEASST